MVDSKKVQILPQREKKVEDSKPEDMAVKDTSVSADTDRKKVVVEVGDENKKSNSKSKLDKEIDVKDSNSEPQEDTETDKREVVNNAKSKRLTSRNIDSAEEEEDKGDAAKGGVCESNEDPYKNVPIENFKPPKGATLEEVSMWEDAVSDLKERIRKLQIGGQALRDIIRKEVRALQLVRFKTFCKYY
jgi:hypothetical protein